MYVLAFDRDWTVDVNPHPRREAVPLEWVQYWAHETGHEVWAIGNQNLVEEADIPGTVESIRRRDGHVDALGEQDEYGYYEWWPEREERLRILGELFPDAEGYIAVDDLDLGHVDGWEHYHAWDFVEHVRQGELGLSVVSGPGRFGLLFWIVVVGSSRIVSDDVRLIQQRVSIDDPTVGHVILIWPAFGGC